MSQSARLALGTAQFGLAYGIGGRDAPVDEAEVRRILERAATAGVGCIDTAPAYGDIEARLPRLCAGLPFRVVSKIAALPAEADPQQAARSALESARRSHARLGPSLDALLLHHADDLLGPGGDAVWHALEGFARDTGVRLGVSCYGPQPLVAVRARYPIALAQLPGNAFDQRIAAQAGACAGLELHLRSVFLQGLLLLPEAVAAQRLPAAAGQLRRWHEWLGQRRIDALQAALSLVKSLPGVAQCIVGVDGLAQLDDILAAWEQAEGASAPELASEQPDIIDPRQWRRAS